MYMRMDLYIWACEIQYKSRLVLPYTFTDFRRFELNLNLYYFLLFQKNSLLFLEKCPNKHFENLELIFNSK